MTKVTSINKPRIVESVYDVIDSITGDYSEKLYGKTLMTLEPTNYVQIDYKEYAFLNVEALRYVYSLVAQKALRMVDVSYLMLLVQEMGKDGVLFQDKWTPHNQKTLCDKYSINSKTLERTISPLIEQNLIARANLSFLRLRCEAYVISPYLIKKGKKTHVEVSILFDELK